MGATVAAARESGGTTTFVTMMDQMEDARATSLKDGITAKCVISQEMLALTMKVAVERLLCRCPLQPLNRQLFRRDLRQLPLELIRNKSRFLSPNSRKKSR